MGDTTAPTVSVAEVTEAAPKQMVLTFSEALATGSVPATSAFAVKIDGSAGPGVSSVAIDGDDATKLKLGLAVALDAGQTNVTVDYTNPGTESNPLKDAADNEVATFTGQSVSNNTPACPGGQPADAFWTACLTVGKSGSGVNTVYGFGAIDGVLSDEAFTLGSTKYTIDDFTRGSYGLSLSFTADPRSASESWILQVGSRSYPLDSKSTYSTGDHSYLWSSPGFTWGAGQDH